MSGAGVTAVQPRATPITVIEATSGFSPIRLAELWAYRELFFFLVWRDVKVRYKQTALGALWALLQPLLTMGVFTLFFGKLAAIDAGGPPYALFAFVGLLPWTLFANGLSGSAQSLVASANLLKKVYFPRIILPAAAVLGGVVDLAISAALGLVLLFAFGRTPSWQMLLAPLFVLQAVLAAIGVGLWLSALNVQFRDVRFVVPFFIQLWLFCSPVIYPSAKLIALLERYGVPGWLYGVNPMAGAVEGFRWSVLPDAGLPLEIVAASAGSTLLLLVTGSFWFRRMERTFADKV